MKDIIKQFRSSGDWPLASDGLQWMIQQRRPNGRWLSIKFIRSTKAHLASRLHHLAPHDDAERLLDGLPETFDAWLAETTGPVAFAH